MRIGSLFLTFTLLALPATASTQTVAGRVVELGSGKVIGHTSVFLVDDSARVVAESRGDSAGIFIASAPGPGVVRVVIYTPGGASFVSPRVELAPADYVERAFVVPEIPASLESVYFARDVDQQVTLRDENKSPRYPPQRRERRERGEVIAFFVVDSTGRVEKDGIQIIRSTHPDFSESIVLALEQMRFHAAVRQAKPVRQVAQLSFAFGFPGDIMHADVLITTFGIVRAPQ